MFAFVLLMQRGHRSAYRIPFKYIQIRSISKVKDKQNLDFVR